MESFGRRRFSSRRGFGGGFSSQDKPVKEGETYDVEILEVGSKGDGIAKVQNFVIFVPGTQKGQKVKIRITQVRARSAVGEVVSGGEAETETIKTEEPEETAAEEQEETEEPEPEEEPEEQPEEQPKEQPEEQPEEKPEEPQEEPEEEEPRKE